MSEFEVFRYSVGQRRPVALKIGQLLLCSLPVEEESRIAFVECQAVKLSIHIRIGEAANPVVKLPEPHFRGAHVLLTRRRPASFQPEDFLSYPSKLLARELQQPEILADLFIDRLLAQTLRGAAGGVASIVGVPLLNFPDEGVPAKAATDEAPKQKIVCGGSTYGLALTHGLRFVEEIARDERLVDAGECLSGASDADDADVEGVRERFGQPIEVEHTASSGAKPSTPEFLGERPEAPLACGVESECLLYERPRCRIDLLRDTSASVEVPDGRG